MGAMSVGARSVFHIAFDSLMFPVHTALAPDIPFALIGTDGEGELIRPALNDLEKKFEEHGANLCAMILEPLLQGAAGMRIYPAAYLRRARELCDRYGVFLIADEVFTGIGRTGAMYACERAGVRPDLMALSKGLSGGYFPFAATLASEKIFEGFSSDNRQHTLFHGHSMTGNPSGCAAALAALELFETENRFGDIRRIEKIHREALHHLETGALSAFIKEVRYIGSVGAVEFVQNEGYTGNFGWEFARQSAEAGVLLRPLGPVVYLTPPYIIENSDLEVVYDVIERTALTILTKK
jgi:adenosylmethionine-8-amino-7-oxononanoate aminotransferase